MKQSKCDRCAARKIAGKYYTKVSGKDPEALCRQCWEVLAREGQIKGHVVVQPKCGITCQDPKRECTNLATTCEYIGGGFYYECDQHSRFVS